MIVYKLVYIEPLEGIKSVMHRESPRGILSGSVYRVQVCSTIYAVNMNDVEERIPISIKIWFYYPQHLANWFVSAGGVPWFLDRPYVFGFCK
jgi:hypothetical protein